MLACVRQDGGMVKRRKTFQASTVDSDEQFTVEVELTKPTGETKSMEFDVWGAAPADATMVLTNMARVTRSGEVAIDGSGMAEFMDYALVGDGPAKWRAMIADPEWKLRAEIIGEVVAYIQEEWSGRPTSPSSNSSPGRTTTSAGSTAPSSAQGPTVSAFTLPVT